MLTKKYRSINSDHIQFDVASNDAILWRTIIYYTNRCVYTCARAISTAGHGTKHVPNLTDSMLNLLTNIPCGQYGQ